MRPYHVILPLVALCLAAAAAQAADTSDALQRYAHAPDGSYHWQLQQRGNYEGGEFVELLLVSQTWQAHVWKHQLFIYRPDGLIDRSAAILIIGGECWDDALELPPTDGQPRQPPNAARWQKLANDTGSVVAVVLQVPLQPMFGELVEDELIVLSFKKYLETGEADWPLLAPMVKSAVRAMDAVHEFTAQQWSLDIERFTLSGASKRGWTSWLTAAVDDRVQSLAPLAIDMLNMRAQTLHQLRSWGTFSEQVADYTRAGLHVKMLTVSGQALTRMVDPYEYRDAVTQPKLIMLGTNDPYWPVDAMNLYWDQLAGPKYVFYLPNANHKLNEQARTANSLAALHLAASGRLDLPQLDWQFVTQDAALQLTIRSDVPPRSVRIWTAGAASRDFRSAKWESQPAEERDNAWHFRLPQHESGYGGMFGELEFSSQAGPYWLSTNLRLVEPKSAGAASGLPNMIQNFLRFAPATQKSQAAAEEPAQKEPAAETRTADEEAAPCAPTEASQ